MVSMECIPVNWGYTVPSKVEIVLGVPGINACGTVSFNASHRTSVKSHSFTAAPFEFGIRQIAIRHAAIQFGFIELGPLQITVFCSEFQIGTPFKFGTVRITMDHTNFRRRLWKFSSLHGTFRKTDISGREIELRAIQETLCKSDMTEFAEIK